AVASAARPAPPDPCGGGGRQAGRARSPRRTTGRACASPPLRRPRSRAPCLRYCRTIVRRPRVIYWVVFLDALLMFAIVPLLPAYGRELHLSKTQAGLVVGVYSGAVLVASPAVGQLSAQVGARRLTIFGTA